METRCCICGRELENQYSMDYLCERCEERYGNYEEDTPTVQPMRKRRRYDDER